MKLHHQIIGSGRPLVIIHGLFGSLDNWRVLAKKLSVNTRVITIDLRNHGRSPHSLEHTYQLMTEDLNDLLDELNIECADIMGHSIGGKVAMNFAKYYPDKIRKLLVVDIAPRQYQPEHINIFEALLTIDLTQYSKRSEVDTVLSRSLPDQAVRQFLLMNIATNGQQLTWRINLQALFDNYPNLLEPVCQGGKVDIPCCVIRGGQSSYINDDDVIMIKQIFTQSNIHLIEHTGHWVHVEAPEEFLEKITEFFDYD